jgi:hypothetical protein
VIRSPENFAKVLDGIAAGLTREQALATLGGRASILYLWMKKSVAAEEAGDTDSVFYFAWPSDEPANYLHHLVRRATERHWKFHQSFLLRSEFAVKDGKPAYETDDFGAVLFDDFGLPCVEQLVIPELPQQRPWKKRRMRWDGSYTGPLGRGRPRLNADGSLRPSSMGFKTPPIVVNPPSAISEYIQQTNPRRPMTDLERDLRDRLAAGPKNAKPSHPVKIIRDEADDAKRERASQPSNQEGLPTQAPDRPARETPQPKPTIDYSRGAKAAAAVDRAGVGPGQPPRGGFRVA